MFEKYGAEYVFEYSHHTVTVTNCKQHKLVQIILFFVPVPVRVLVRALVHHFNAQAVRIVATCSFVKFE